MYEMMTNEIDTLALKYHKYTYFHDTYAICNKHIWHFGITYEYAPRASAYKIHHTLTLWNLISFKETKFYAPHHVNTLSALTIQKNLAPILTLISSRTISS